jgi:arylsulfatase A-like enzyme
MRLLPALLLTFLVALTAHAAENSRGPNVVFILCDDLGYGDVKCLNKDGKIATPHMDRLAAGGMIFTDAHSSSAVCSPTRYGIITGRYNWRSRLKAGVLGGYSPRLIEEGRLTVAQMLKDHGYATACIGKWHLGMEFPLKDGSYAKDYKDSPNTDWTKPIINGPNAVGFDEYFGISASLDMPPWAFIENQKVVPPIPDHEEALWKGRPGPVSPGWKHEDVLPKLTERAVSYIGRSAQTSGGKPFFLYLPLNSPHTPIAPSAAWKGKSAISEYADFVMETDWAIGQVLDALAKAGVADNTLVFVISDNGCSPSADFKTLAEHGHHPSYLFRGMKADIFDGGHHIPLIARWLGRVVAGSKYDHPVCLVDFMATVADIIGFKLPDNAAEDSVSLMPALTGKTTAPIHEAVVHHSINGSFAIRQGKWKLELCRSSGGWSDPKPASPAAQKLPDVQLYDLSTDIGETKNVYADHPDVVASMTKLLEKYVAEGRSTPGSPQQNTTPVVIVDPSRETPRGKKAAKKNGD